MTGLLNHLRDRLSSLLSEPEPEKLIVNSVGQQESEVPPETIQAVMEWLFASLMHAGYCGQAHLFWLYAQAEPVQNQKLQHCHRRGEPVLGYRCGTRMPAPPSGYYWRLMPEYASMRIYQLETKDDD